MQLKGSLAVILEFEQNVSIDGGIFCMDHFYSVASHFVPLHEKMINNFGKFLSENHLAELTHFPVFVLLHFYFFGIIFITFCVNQIHFHALF